MDNLFEIEARAPGNPTKDQMRLMMQSLLADRFRLAVHFESQEGPVLALTLVRPGQTGPGLRPHADGPACPESYEVPSGPFPNANEVFPLSCDTGQTRSTSSGALQVGSRNTTLELLGNEIYALGSIAGGIDRPVVDRTGLKGGSTLFWSCGDTDYFPRCRAHPNSENPPSDPQGILLSALREQLGLKLVSSRGAIRALVIDQMRGLKYFLEVFIARDFLEGWLANLDTEPQLQEKCAGIIKYALTDA